ncbi:MAG: hypothetical protein JO141_16315 [Bradyrhizobium sp.]|nr:hypothetical protein [Bradyrhizobium sp.]
MSLSGILSKPWSPLASLPPELDVPLPLRLGFMALPVVGDVPGVAELAAGSPLTAPLPLAPPDWAKAAPEQSTTAVTTAGFKTFMTKSLTCGIKALRLPLVPECEAARLPRNSLPVGGTVKRPGALVRLGLMKRVPSILVILPA